MRTTGITRGRNLTYGLIAALALGLGMAGPVHAASTSVQIAGDTTIKITAKARTSEIVLKKKARLHARSLITYEATVLGLPLPLTAAYYNSIPLQFDKPRLDETNADLVSNTYKSARDPWLKTDQWIVRGDKGFWGTLSVNVKGSAVAKTAGQKFFHSGTGTGHAVDANAALRITVK